MNKLDKTYSRVAYIIAEAMVGCYEEPEPKKPTKEEFKGNIMQYHTAMLNWQKDALQYQFANETLYNTRMRELLLVGLSERRIDVHPAEIIGGNHEQDKPPPQPNLDASIIEYKNINATTYFRSRHMLLANSRQKFIEQYWNDGKCRSQYDYVTLESKPIKELLAIANPHGQERVRALLANGFFTTGNGGKSRRQTFVLSKKQNLFIDLKAGPELNTVRFCVVEQSFHGRVSRNTHGKIYHLGR